MSAALYSLCYYFLLRARAEALPLVVASSPEQPAVAAACAVLIIDVTNKQLTLRLARRKNRAQESSVKMNCMCHMTRCASFIRFWLSIVRCA